MTDVMIDLETLSTRSNAAILTIGAIKFKRDSNYDAKRDYTTLPKKDVFYRRITLTSCIHADMHIDKNTVEWWVKQGEEARNEALFHLDRVPLKKALKELSAWIGTSKYVWGNGSSFDITILEEAYRRCKLTPIWKFWNVRDLRTVYDLGKVWSVHVPNSGHHHALHDCYSQILGFQIAMKNIKKK